MRNVLNRLFNRRQRTRAQRGQVLVIVVFAMIGLISAIGLVVDVGITFIQYGRLRRAVDAAALSASLQFREGVQLDQLTLAATEFLKLNDIDDPTAIVTNCEVDASLCDKNGNGLMDPGENRKFVHVVASTDAHLAFMPILGIRTVHLTAEAVSEAASLDVVLVIDVSESMTFDAPPGDPMRDPSVCNAAVSGGPYTGDCSPFLDVKVAASSFVDQLFFPYDRVAVITFDRNVHTDILSLDHCEVLGLDQATCYNQVQNAIRHLSVYQAGGVPGTDVGGFGPNSITCENDPPVNGPCRTYNQDTQEYIGFDCPAYHNTGNPASCTTTNIGGGLLEAANEFGRSTREDALWVVILLTDGAANSSTDVTMTEPFGFCPASTHTQPFCRDQQVSTRHCADADTRDRCIAEGGVWDPINYDADDFARDMADFAGKDQQALIFTIGLGNLVINAPQGDPDAGEQLMMYSANAGGGLYYFAPTGDQLRDIFKQIADNIAVRLTR